MKGIEAPVGQVNNYPNVPNKHILWVFISVLKGFVLESWVYDEWGTDTGDSSSGACLLLVCSLTVSS